MNQQPFSYPSVFFYTPLHFFLSRLFLLSPLMACCLSPSVLLSQYFSHLHPFPFVLFHPASFSVCLFIALSSCLSSIPTSFCSVCFTLSSFPSPFSLLSSSARAFAFDVHTFPSFNAAALMQREVCLNCLSALWIFFCTLRGGIIEHEGKLDREKEKGCSRAEISKISLQQQETEITVDQGIKLLPYGFPMCTVRVNSFHFSLSPQSPPLFFFFTYYSVIVCQRVCHPFSSSPRNRIQKEEKKSSDNHTSSSIRHHPSFSAFFPVRSFSSSSFEICFLRCLFHSVFFSQWQTPPNSCSVSVPSCCPSLYLRFPVMSVWSSPSVSHAALWNEHPKALKACFLILFRMSSGVLDEQQMSLYLPYYQKIDFWNILTHPMHHFEKLV